MDTFKFINKKHIKTKDKEFFNCNLFNTKLEDIVTLFIDQKVYESLTYKFNDIVDSNRLSSSSYINKYGQTVTSIKLVQYIKN